IIIMRVFIAVEIPERIRSEIESAVKVCHKNVKQVPKSNIHITMEFLGELDQSGLQRVISMLEDVKFEPFSVSLGKAGTFDKSARVAFVHVETGTDKLKTLQSYIHNRLSKI
ncbi:2'-5' RNA ligase, partial [mine drainage metagenome]